MRLSTFPIGALLLSGVCARLPSKRSDDSANNTAPQPDENGKYWIHGGGISAAFIAYGAAVSNILVKDRYGVERDIIAGYDNATAYELDKAHPHLGAVPGRYANRIKNSTFEIDGQTYHVLPNENPTADHPDGVDTLHGGPKGWDWRNFTVETHTKNSLTLKIVDPDGEQGFPGEVVSYVTYTLGDSTWDIRMVALPTTKKTPIMLSSHTYWNLDGFANNETSTALNHTFYLPHSGQRVGVDNILIPTGDIVANAPGSVNDFWSAPKQIGSAFQDDEIHNNCGFNCTGFDTCFLVNRGQDGPYDWRAEGGFVARLQSAWSGIQVDVYTDQEAFQMYSCNGGELQAIKKTQGHFNDPKFPRVVPQYGCIVMEVEDWIDAINQPEWQRSKKHIFEPGGDPYVLHATYKFSINATETPF